MGKEPYRIAHENLAFIAVGKLDIVAWHSLSNRAIWNICSTHLNLENGSKLRSSISLHYPLLHQLCPEFRNRMRQRRGPTEDSSKLSSTKDILVDSFRR